MWVCGCCWTPAVQRGVVHVGVPRRRVACAGVSRVRSPRCLPEERRPRRRSTTVCLQLFKRYCRRRPLLRPETALTNRHRCTVWSRTTRFVQTAPSIAWVSTARRCVKRCMCTPLYRCVAVSRCVATMCVCAAPALPRTVRVTLGRSAEGGPTRRPRPVVVPHQRQCQRTQQMTVVAVAAAVAPVQRVPPPTAPAQTWPALPSASCFELRVA